MATALLLAKVKGGIVWLVIAGILTASLGFCTREALPETRPELVESIPVQELSRKEHHRSKPAEPGRPRTDSYGDPIPEGARARLGTVRFRDLTSPTAQLIYAGGGKVLISAGMQFSGICAWDADSGRPRYRLTAPRIAMSLAVSPDGKSPFSQGDLGIFWGIDIATGKALRQFTPGIWGQAAFSSDGKTVAVAANDEWRVLRWDFATGKMLPPLAKDGEIGSAVAFSPDGKLMATASNDHSIRLWDSVTGKERHRLAGHDKPVYSLAFAASGKILASAGEGSTIRLWNLDTGKQLRLLAGEKGYNSRVVFSPDGRLLASTGGDGEFRRASVHIGTLGLWDPHTGKELHRWERIYAWAFSPDAKVLATTSPEGVIRRWDTVTYKEIDPPHGHVGRIWSLRFAADGKSLFSRLRWTSGGVGSDNRPATALVIRWINRIGKPLPMVR